MAGLDRGCPRRIGKAMWQRPHPGREVMAARRLPPDCLAHGTSRTVSGATTIAAVPAKGGGPNAKSLPAVAALVVAPVDRTLRRGETPETSRQEHEPGARPRSA